MGELVDDVEQAELASIMGALLDKVVGPDVVGALGSQPDARSVIEPQPSTLELSGGDLQPLASPDPLDPLVVDQPAGPAQQFGDLAITVAAILLGQLDEVGSQPLLIGVLRMAEYAGRKAALVLHRCRWLSDPHCRRSLGRMEEPRHW